MLQLSLMRNLKETKSRGGFNSCSLPKNESVDRKKCIPYTKVRKKTDDGDVVINLEYVTD